MHVMHGQRKAIMHNVHKKCDAAVLRLRADSHQYA